MGDCTLLVGWKASVPALVWPDVATRRFPMGAPMLPNAAAAWYIPAAGLFCAFWWWWPKGIAAHRVDSSGRCLRYERIRLDAAAVLKDVE